MSLANETLYISAGEPNCDFLEIAEYQMRNAQPTSECLGTVPRLSHTRLRLEATCR